MLRPPWAGKPSAAWLRARLVAPRRARQKSPAESLPLYWCLQASESPLLVAVAAGSAALPQLLKLAQLLKVGGGAPICFAENP